jgi:hypothetical protein
MPTGPHENLVVWLDPQEETRTAAAIASIRCPHGAPTSDDEARPDRPLENRRGTSSTLAHRTAASWNEGSSPAVDAPRGETTSTRRQLALATERWYGARAAQTEPHDMGGRV